jgi:uncharacterized damage-inducible protein DinB
MTISEGLLQELEQEAHTTRRVLARVPQEHLEWRPHAKAMTLGQLAMHVATIPGGVAEFVVADAKEVPGFPQPTVDNVRQLLPLLDESVANARAVLASMTDAQMQATWRLVNGAQTIMAVPRMAFLRTVMLNHWYHHRGQLSTYLRHLGVALPSIYGPRADENPFIAAATTATT